MNTLYKETTVLMKLIHFVDNLKFLLCFYHLSWQFLMRVVSINHLLKYSRLLSKNSCHREKIHNSQYYLAFNIYCASKPKVELFLGAGPFPLTSWPSLFSVCKVKDDILSLEQLLDSDHASKIPC